MVKADPKHDYYADLELPSTADSDTIKKQFRLLAKQYHPDRNQGHEIEVIPKFQAIQAANEILSDPTQKKKYDSDRAVQNQSSSGTDPKYAFKKPAKPPPPHPSHFPPPPKRNPNLNQPRPPFGTSNSSRPTSSASAERFAPFTRAAPQQWDRQKYEAEVKAETLRNLQNMRPQSQGPPPRVPPRTAPTAPKSSSNAPSPDPGFPGLSRTNSGRRGFAPGTPGADEPPAPSAYAHVHRADRPPSASASYSYPPNLAQGGSSASPPAQKTRSSMSPLRPSKSSGFEEHRPDLSRSSSRYVGNSGERTDINGPRVARSASVRASPTDRHWDESGAFGSRPQSQQQPHGFKVPPTRHRSTSPRRRDPQFSESETSSSDDEPPNNHLRPRATPRKFPSKSPTNSRPFSDNDSAFTGQFPSSNHNTKVSDDRQYNYPPPDMNGTPYRRNFTDASNPLDDLTEGMSSAGIRHVHRDDVPTQKYDDPTSRTMRKPWESPVNAKVLYKRDTMINGIPVWALPSSIYPARPELQRYGPGFYPHTASSYYDPFQEQSQFHVVDHCRVQHANISHSQSSQHSNGVSSEAQSAVPPNTNATFSAADWDGKFVNGDNIFRPTESKSRSRSPTKTPKPKVPNRNRGISRDQGDREDGGSASGETAPQMPGVRHVSGVADGLSKAAAFQAGRFSAEDWAERLRSQNKNVPPKVPPRESPVLPRVSVDPPGAYDTAANHTTPPSDGHQDTHQQSAAEPDAMEVDEAISKQGPAPVTGETVPKPLSKASRQPSSGGIDLNELRNTAPFKPSAAGLGDLGDLHDTLPFESRAADELNLRQPPSSGPAARQLKLPTPPKPIPPPDGAHLSQEKWNDYAGKMSKYIDAWNIFSCKMIDHFKVRQEQISHTMYHNWVTAMGDGASADDFDGLDFVGSEVVQVNGDENPRVRSKKAGYATYMQWLQQDKVCRTWWEVAIDEHTRCMEDLGHVRKLVKTIVAKEAGKTV